MKRVYVAGPYSADNVIDVLKNIGKGENVCANLFADGYYPFCPFHDKDFIIKQPNIDFRVDQFYEYSLAWLEVSEALLVLEGHENSKGTLKEIEFALKKNIPIFYDYLDLINYFES